MTDRPMGIPRKRNRIPLSCESCRIRKLKCDRQKPCLNCLSRDLSCVFANGNAPKARGRPQPAPNEDLRSKLHRLEQLVSVMAENAGVASEDPSQQQETPPSTDSPHSSTSTPDFEARPGHLVKADRGQHYVGPTSWETILHDIADIREQFDDLPHTLDEQTTFTTRRNPAILGGVSCDVTYTELREGLPSRTLADRLIARFFDSFDPAAPSRLILHKPTFLKQFDNLWATKENGFCPQLMGTSYSVFCQALQSYYRQNDEPSDLRGRTRELADLYHKRAAQCVLKSDITAPVRRGVEALLLCLICEYSRLGEGFIGQWFSLGIVVRKALHLGLHRDPDEFPSLSPFEKEMRRRLWAHVWQVDMMFSFQLGLPNAVQNFKFRVSPPTNLLEEEMSEDMTELPPARPPNEPTPINFTISKLHLSQSVTEVIDYLNVRGTFSFEEVGELNRKLHKAWLQIPEYLRIQSWEQSLGASRTIRLQRLQLQLYYDKATCTLNRRFISLAEHRRAACMDPRRLCVDSALNILSIQESYELEQCQWWLYYFTKRDFLLAATILYLVLFTRQKERQQGLPQPPGTDPQALDQEDARIQKALDHSQAIWSRLNDESGEGRRACRMFDSMRRQLQTADFESRFQPPPAMSPPRAEVNASIMDLSLENLDPNQSDAPYGDANGFSIDPRFADFDWAQWENAIQLPAMDGLDGVWPGENGFNDLGN